MYSNFRNCYFWLRFNIVAEPYQGSVIKSDPFKFTLKILSGPGVSNAFLKSPKA